MSKERYRLNDNLARMLKGGVIMDVTTPKEAEIAETAGAVAVMALERVQLISAGRVVWRVCQTRK